MEQQDGEGTAAVSHRRVILANLGGKHLTTPVLPNLIIPECDTGLVVKSLMQC